MDIKKIMNRLFIILPNNFSVLNLQGKKSVLNLQESGLTDLWSILLKDQMKMKSKVESFCRTKQKKQEKEVDSWLPHMGSELLFLFSATEIPRGEHIYQDFFGDLISTNIRRPAAACWSFKYSFDSCWFTQYQQKFNVSFVFSQKACWSRNTPESQSGTLLNWTHLVIL